MAGLIPESFIDDLLARVDIVDVVERRVPLKKSGHEWQACCPFHNEKTPSFTVSPKKQFYHCFGCGVHGSAITFLMEYEHLEFPDAVEELAHDFGLAVPREGGQAPRRSHQGLYALMDEVAGHYRKALAEDSGALDYCQKRGLDEDARAAFGIGWAPGNDLIKQLGATPERSKMLEEAGLLARNDRGPYERFRRRLMIPIRDRRGRVVAFGGRLLEGDGPKYLNSPETPLFHKGRELFGLWEVKQANRKLERIVVVEGYMDAIALHQAGLPIAVATLGTSTTSEHAERLFRSAADIVFAFDGDRAGREAAWRALENILPQLSDGRQAWFLFLPEGQDPDDVVRAEGADGFRRRLDQAMPLSDYLFAELERHIDTTSMDGRARLVSQAQPLLQKLPEGSFRQLLTSELEGRTGASVRIARRPPAARRARAVQRRASLVRNLVALVLHQPDLAREVDADEAVRTLQLPGIELLAELLAAARARDDMTTAMLLQQFDGHQHSDSLHRLVTAEHLVPGEALRDEFLDGIKVLKRQATTQRIAELSAAHKQGALEPAAREELRRLLARKASGDADSLG